MKTRTRVKVILKKRRSSVRDMPGGNRNLQNEALEDRIRELVRGLSPQEAELLDRYLVLFHELGRHCDRQDLLNALERIAAGLAQRPEPRPPGFFDPNNRHRQLPAAPVLPREPKAPR